MNNDDITQDYEDPDATVDVHQPSFPAKNSTTTTTTTSNNDNDNDNEQTLDFDMIDDMETITSVTPSK